MNVLMLGCDPSFFARRDEGFADVAARHVAYAQSLAARAGTAELRIVTYTRRESGIDDRRLSEHLTLYPTRSIHRSTFGADLLRTLPRVLRGWRPDLITTQNAWSEANLGALLARATGSAFLPQLHANVFSDAFVAGRPINRWRSQVAAWHCRHATGIRVVTAAQKQSLVARFGIPETKIFVVPVATSIEPVTPGKPKDFYRARLGSDLTGKEIVLLVARFDGSKNLPLWIAACDQIAAQRPDARFVIVGDGPERSAVDAAIVDSAFSHRFTRTGLVGPDALPEIYAAADVFMLSSDHESFGRVLVEAALCGVPSVSTNCDGPAEIIVDGETGLLVPRRDAPALAEATMRLLAAPETRSRYGVAARCRVIECYGHKTLVARMVDCWTKVASMGARDR